MYPQNKVLDSLSQIPFFKHLARDELAALAGLAQERRIEKGDLIFTAEERCRHFHMLFAGEVKIFVVSEEGREQIIHMLKPPVFFGEEILFGENRYEANAEALSKTILYNISKQDLEHFILSHPQVSIALLAYFGRRLKRLMRMIGDMALKDVQYRLVCRLVQMADEEGEVTADGIEITGLTHQDLASHLGTVREHLSRCLTRLQDARLIKLGRKKIIVQDIESLKDLSHNPRVALPTQPTS